MRIVNYILSASEKDIKALIASLIKVKQSIRLCNICNNLTDTDTCHICQSLQRNKDLICIVEYPSDVLAIEKTGKYNGLYYVLMGSIAPLDGRGPGDLNLDKLIKRIKQNNIKEVIIATGSNTEGQITALYISKTLKNLNIKLSRIGLGIPVGANLEYIDSATMTEAIESRKVLQ